jgi:hypothetical protein
MKRPLVSEVELAEARRKTLFILYKSERNFGKPRYFGTQMTFGVRILFAIGFGLVGWFFMLGLRM